MRNQERIKEQGKRLRAERLSRGITQEAIAEVMDVSERQYRRYESGESVLPLEVLKAFYKYGIDYNYVGQGILSIDIEIQHGMESMPEDQYEEIFREVRENQQKNKEDFDGNIYIEETLKLLTKFSAYNKENPTAPQIRETPQIDIFTMLYEEAALSEYLETTRLDLWTKKIRKEHHKRKKSERNV